jgi:hypothetical protein
MSEIYNIYCDESCHLEKDKIPVMVLGAVSSGLAGFISIYSIWVYST